MLRQTSSSSGFLGIVFLGEKMENKFFKTWAELTEDQKNTCRGELFGIGEEALEKLKAAETAALAAPQTAEPTADVTAEPTEEESLPATDTSVLAAAVTTDALYIRRSGDWDAEALALPG